MSILLNIDTSTSEASLGLAKDGHLLAWTQNAAQKDHAAWIHEAIRTLLQQANLNIRDLSAVGLCQGPGSYTGLRVGMAAAKGICYALQIPLICENTLKVMARACMEEQAIPSGDLICPMIDARRMEVFTALFSSPDLETVLEPCALVLNKNSFDHVNSSHTIWFAGSGSGKWEGMAEGPRDRFIYKLFIIKYLSIITFEKYQKGAYSDLVYCEPFYLKEFQSQTLK